MSRLYQRLQYSGEDNTRLPALSFGQASSSSRPGLSFLLGTGLIVVIILFISALFSFCYHWLRLKPLSPSSSLDSTQLPSLPRPDADDCCKAPSISTKLAMLQCVPVVYMAGEHMPRFIALPYPVTEAPPYGVTMWNQRKPV